MRYKQGFVLISAIILIVFVSIAVLGLSFFILEKSRKLSTQEAQLKSFYLSEAGIQEALYWFRKSGSFSLGQREIVSGESFTLSGDESGLLMADPRNTRIRTRKRYYEVRDLYVNSATDSIDLTITRMFAAWSDSGSRLLQINIGGRRVWRGNAASPANCDIQDTSIGTQRKNVVLYFSYGDPSQQTVGVRFVMQDATYKQLQVYPAPSEPEYNFTVQSTGQVVWPSFSLTAKIETEYNAATEQIVRYERLQ